MAVRYSLIIKLHIHWLWLVCTWPFDISKLIKLVSLILPLKQPFKIPLYVILVLVKESGLINHVLGCCCCCCCASTLIILKNTLTSGAINIFAKLYYYIVASIQHTAKQLLPVLLSSPLEDCKRCGVLFYFTITCLLLKKYSFLQI